jgi:hypothetical protein
VYHENRVCARHIDEDCVFELCTSFSRRLHNHRAHQPKGGRHVQVPSTVTSIHPASSCQSNAAHPVLDHAHKLAVLGRDAPSVESMLYQLAVAETNSRDQLVVVSSGRKHTRQLIGM